MPLRCCFPTSKDEVDKAPEPSAPSSPPAPSVPSATSAHQTTKQPITITYSQSGSPDRTESFDFLIVACDPRTLPFAEQTALESQVKSALTSFTFRTSLFRATRPDHPEIPLSGGPRENTPNYAVRFHPGVLSNLAAGLYGFRDEVKARDANFAASPNGITWLTTYQLEGVPLLNRSTDEARKNFDQRRDAAIYSNAPEDTWLDWKPIVGQEPQPVENAIVDYFPHFESSDLGRDLPWKIRDAQGLNNTLYVSSFTCFESVLHCYLYAEMLMDANGPVIGRFPNDRNARIAVIGAGPSGLMFASQHLFKNGYTNFTIFEQQARYGGKTYTFPKPIPATPSETVPCELGTCYLSPAYEPLYHLFEEYDAGRVVALDRGSNQFRSIIDPKLAKNQQEKEDGVEYGAWTVRKNGPIYVWERLAIIIAAIRYLVVHYATMGMTINDPMPVEPPTELSVLENLHRLLKESHGLNADNDKVKAKNMYSLLKKEKRSNDVQSKKKSGLFDVLDDFGFAMNDVEDYINVQDLEKACKSVFNTSFGKFLDENNMDELKSIFVYGYQVQGYGTIELIPAYYGMIWMTPAVFTGDIRRLFNPPGSRDPERGTVNVVSEGWGTLWDKIVERDLRGKIQFETSIRNITRVMTP